MLVEYLKIELQKGQNIKTCQYEEKQNLTHIFRHIDMLFWYLVSHLSKEKRKIFHIDFWSSAAGVRLIPEVLVICKEN